MDHITCKEEHFVDVESYGDTSAVVPEDIEEVMIPDFDSSRPPVHNEVSCHFFYPSTDEEDGYGAADNQVDPLASPVPEWVDCSAFESDHNSGDELGGPGNMTGDSFSVIDPLLIVKSERPRIKMELFGEQVDIKPSVLQLKQESMNYGRSEENEEHETVPSTNINFGLPNGFDLASNSSEVFNNTVPSEEVNPGPSLNSSKISNSTVPSKRMTRGPSLNSSKISNNTVPSKRMNSGPGLRSSKIVLKDLAVNIGPKLPLPRCFQQGNSCKSERRSARTPSQSEVRKKLDFTCQESSQPECLNSEHIVLKIYTCPKCKYKSTESAVYEAHVATCGTTSVIDDFSSSTSVTNELYCCETCIYKFKNKCNLLEHVKKHSSNKFQCFICNMEFSTVSRLRTHSTDVHKNLTKVFSCNVCEYSTMYHSHLKEHMIRHISDRHLYCTSCRRNFEDLEDYDEHLLKLHNGTFNRKKKSNEIKQTEKDENLSKMESSFMSEVVIHNGVYYCNGCSYKFSKLENLITHKKQHMKTKKPFKCPKCSHQSLSIVNMIDHAKSHSGSGRVACNECSLPLKHWSSVRTHTFRHVNDGLYCTPCRKNCEDKQSLKEHMLSVHKEDVRSAYSCSKCSFTHSLASIFKRHMRRHMKKENEISSSTRLESPISSCNEATSGISEEENVSNVNSDLSSDHQRLDIKSEKCNEESNLKCEECQLKFLSVVAFEEHKSLHSSRTDTLSEINPDEDLKTLMFKCLKCNYGTSEMSSFEEHTKLGHLPRNEPFICNVCNGKHCYLKNYIFHLKSHAGSPRFLCKYCPYSTKRELHFVRHMTNHDLKSCTLCNYKTQRTQLFKDHIKNQHNPDFKPFYCSLCPFASLYERVLTAHSVKSHPKEYASLRLPIPSNLKPMERMSVNSYACNMCPFKCSRTDSLKRHVETHFESHPKEYASLRLPIPSNLKPMERKSVKSHACNMCPFKCSRTDSLKRHVETHFESHPKEYASLRLPIPSNLKPMERKSVKSHACNMCPFKCSRTDNLKRHVKTHFVSRSFTAKKSRSKQIPQGPSQNRSRNKLHSLKNVGTNKNTKKPVVKMAAKLNDSVSAYFRCSQCDYQRKTRKYVIKHVRSEHGIIGEIVKHMIVKVSVSQNEDVETLQNMSKKLNHRPTEEEPLVKVEPNSLANTHPTEQKPLVKVKPKTVAHRHPIEQKPLVKVKPKRVAHSHPTERKPLVKEPKRLQQKVLQEKRFSCIKCDAQFKNKGSLYRHVQKHGPNTFSCTNCNTFSSYRKDSLKKHLFTCLRRPETLEKQERRILCKKTDQKDNKSKNGDEGGELNSDDESFSCGECSFVTLDVTQLITHMFVHSGIPDD